jgi:hypothetical protein
MKMTKRRLEKLEKRVQIKTDVPRVEFFDGTVKEVEARRDEVEGQNVILISPSPRVGETMNEARISAGLEQWLVKGWDEPRSKEKTPL